MSIRGLGVARADGNVELLDLPAPPEPGPGQLLIGVEAAGMGPWDPLLYTGGWDVGLVLPAALGVEGAGSVIAVGPDVTGFAPGDRVLSHEAPLPGGSGFWAEQVLVGAHTVAHCPSELISVSAAALPIAGLTARQVIDTLNVGNGFRLLVTGGAGATGAVVVQLAAAAGAEVTITASAQHHDRLTQLGAYAVIDYQSPDWTAGVRGGFDAVLTAAPGTAADAISVIRDGGKLLTLTGDAPESERGIDCSDFYVEPNGAQLAEVAELVAKGRLTLNPETVQLNQAAAAYDTVAASKTGGRKIVLTLAS